MQKIENENTIILIADEGKYITNGDTYGIKVTLPIAANHFIWKEVTEEELPKTELPE